MAIIEQQAFDIKIIEYLKTPPDVDELKAILTALNLPVSAIIRTGEPQYKELKAKSDSIDEDQWLENISQHPKLLQRPIVCWQNHAVIGRPPENVHDLIALINK